MTDLSRLIIPMRFDPEYIGSGSHNRISPFSWVACLRYSRWDKLACVWCIAVNDLYWQWIKMFNTFMYNYIHWSKSDYNLSRSNANFCYVLSRKKQRFLWVFCVCIDDYSALVMKAQRVASDRCDKCQLVVHRWSGPHTAEWMHWWRASSACASWRHRGPESGRYNIFDTCYRWTHRFNS